MEPSQAEEEEIIAPGETAEEPAIPTGSRALPVCATQGAPHSAPTENLEIDEKKTLSEARSQVVSIHKASGKLMGNNDVWSFLCMWSF